MVTYAMLSEIGSRNINQDYVGIGQKENHNIFILADGLGGHGQGEVASELAVNTVLSIFEDNSIKYNGDILPYCIEEAHNAIIREQTHLGLMDEMKTTINVLYFNMNKISWIHVGDSRLYIFKKNKLYYRTLDHSVSQMLVTQGVIRERDIRFHEDRNRLIRVLGMECEQLKYDFSNGEIVSIPMSFLLCSDGFWELIEEKDMSKQLRYAKNPDDWLNRMKEIVEKNGSGKNMDNYSAIAVFIR